MERAFGALISRRHILARPLTLWYKDDISTIVEACVILHNMVAENRGERYSSDMLSHLKVIDRHIIEVRASKMSYDKKNIILGTVSGVWQS